MNEICEKVKEKLSLTENMYDSIRIIDPVNKTIINIKNDEIKRFKGNCYDILNKGRICSNCTSMRAKAEEDTFIKIECILNKVTLIISTSVIRNEDIYVVEILKDISSHKGKILDIDDNAVNIMINRMNEKIIRDDLTGIYNRIYIEERLPVDINNSIKNKTLFFVIMIEIDNLKKINDKYGQTIGAKILKNCTESISDSVDKNSSWLGRYSDNKFIIGLNNIDKEKVSEILEQIRNLLEDNPFKYNDKIFKLKFNFSNYCSENEITDIKDVLLELEKGIFEEKQKKLDGRINKDKKLSILNYRIEELRNILNEMCISSNEKAEYKQTLKISQDLDELIVEYMKNVQ